MLFTNRQILKWIYYFCVGQFLLILMAVLIFHHPITKFSVTLVGASAIFGLLFSGAVRRNIQIRKELAEKYQRYNELDDTLKKICDGKEN